MKPKPEPVRHDPPPDPMAAVFDRRRADQDVKYAAQRRQRLLREAMAQREATDD